MQINVMLANKLAPPRYSFQLLFYFGAQCCFVMSVEVDIYSRPPLVATTVNYLLLGVSRRD